jgi:hypothetical protein
MGKCSFKKSWLLKTDESGHQISEWAIKHENGAYCKVCMTTINVSKGFQALTKHSKTKNYMEMCKIKLSTLQPRLTKSSSDSTVSNKQNSDIKIYCLRDSAIKAELMWCMKMISCNFSANSCLGIADLFKSMFSDAVPTKFSICPKKFRYEKF